MAMQKLYKANELSAKLKKAGRLVAKLPYVCGGQEFLVLCGQTPLTWFEYTLVAEIKATEEGPQWSQRAGSPRVYNSAFELVSSNEGYYCYLQWTEPETWGIEIPMPAKNTIKPAEKPEIDVSADVMEMLEKAFQKAQEAKNA